MDWFFTPDNTGALNRKVATTYTDGSQGSLTHLEMFVREVLQNALDDDDRGDPVRVRFRLIVKPSTHNHRRNSRSEVDELKEGEAKEL